MSLGLTLSHKVELLLFNHILLKLSYYSLTISLGRIDFENKR